ncbi:hypothetical protein Drorol1_Dr00000922, partial [Drosera rotundifolia]
MKLNPNDSSSLQHQLRPPNPSSHSNPALRMNLRSQSNDDGATSLDSPRTGYHALTPSLRESEQGERNGEVKS